MWDTITGLYIACLAIGFIYALIGAIFGELGSHGDVAVGDHGMDIGGHDFDAGDHGGLDFGDHDVAIGDHANLSYAEIHGLHVSPLNTITIATFVGSFGAMGLIAQWGLKLAPLASLAFAIPMAVLAAGIQFYLYSKILIGSSASSEATMADIAKCTAEVITPIPEGGIGEIAYNIKGVRYTAPARSVEGGSVPRGGRVRIVRSAAGVMQVREF